VTSCVSQPPKGPRRMLRPRGYAPLQPRQGISVTIFACRWTRS
jgi:hypothetical protein